MMSSAGYNFIWSWFVSQTVYTGAFQYVLVDYLKTGTAVTTIILTALFMNSRMLFYGIPYIDKFKKLGKFYPYMIFSLTDETYALYTSMNGTIIGGLLGSLLPFDFKGIDFCMTALFITIFIDKWKNKKDRLSAFLGLICGVVSLVIFGAKSFIFPAMVSTMFLLVINKKLKDCRVKSNE